MTQQTVRRRHVFFISGFDPKGAAYYHRLYESGAARQQLASRQAYEVSSRKRTEDLDVQQWRILWQSAPSDLAVRVDTTLEFLAWDDLVRANWPRGVASMLWGSLRAYVAALSSRPALLSVWQQSPRTLIALAYPVLVWSAALLIGILLAWLAVQITHRVEAFSAWTPNAKSICSWALAAAALTFSCWTALLLERKLQTSWLLRIYRFTDLWARGQLPDLDERLTKMARRVEERMRLQDTDEVLIVGYSVGSMLAASVVARVLMHCGKEASLVQRLSFLTLGQCIPLLGLMPRAGRFHGDLDVLAAAVDLCWVDYSSLADWGSFALVDPLVMCRSRPVGGRMLTPAMRSPRFHTLFEPEEYRLLRKSKRRMHLQYLMASPKAGGYDYFLMTAGPLRLSQGLLTGSSC